MKIKKLLLFIILFITSYCVFSQEFDMEQYYEEKEKIINTVLNSPEFDSVYNFQQVYIKANELVHCDTPMDLKKNGKSVVILDDLKALDSIGLPYVHIGDLTADWNNPIAVRVMIEIINLRKGLRTHFNWGLKKIKTKWIFVHKPFIYEDSIRNSKKY